MGYVARSAVIMIVMQNYMVGEKAGKHPDKYPDVAPAVALSAVSKIKSIIGAVRNGGAPIVNIRFAIDREAGDTGLFDAKSNAPASENVYLEGIHGSEIVEKVAPELGDLVITKKKPSNLLGTPLFPYLIERQVDTLIITSGSTCDCVRATVFDAFSYNFRAIVTSDAVLDHMSASHAINLFDVNRCSADVTESSEVVENLSGIESSSAP